MEFIGEDFVDDLTAEEIPYVGFTPLVKAFTQVWDLMLGDNDYRFKTPIGLIAYYVCTVFVQIAMLNIVISVVSDTYDKVVMSKKKYDLRTKAELLYDLAEFLSILKGCCSCLRSKEERLGFLYVL